MSLPGNTPLTIAIRPMADDDRRFVRATLLESHHKSPDMHRVRWPLYKLRFGKLASELLERTDVRLLGAYNEAGRILGWVAYSPGKSIDTLHYAYTRYDLDGAQYRRRGIMTALLEAAGLLARGRFVFSLRGEYKLGGPRSKKFLPRPLDEVLVSWLRGRGVTAVYESLTDWIKE